MRVSAAAPTVLPAVVRRVVVASRGPCARFALSLVALLLFGGCATIRVTDPPRTATEQFLLSGSIQDAIGQLSMDGLRDQMVFVDATYLTGDPTQSQTASVVQRDRPAQDFLFLVGELRSRLLREGARLTDKRDDATVICEVRSGGVGIDRYEFLLGLPSTALTNVSGTGGLPIAIPELSILKSTRQLAFSTVSIVAFRTKSGELVSQSGPFVGKRLRADYWIFGTGPNTVGDIAPAEK
jgi:hypothetical protein